MDPIMRKWMGKPARKIKAEEVAKVCPVSGKGGDKCPASEAKPGEKEAELSDNEPEVTNIDESGDSDDEPVVVERRTTRSRSRKAE